MRARMWLFPPLSLMTATPVFEKNPARWAATPKFRFRLHQSLEQKLSDISCYAPTAPVRCNPDAAGTKAIVVSGVAAAHTRDVLKDLGLWDRIPLYQVLQPFPLHREFIDHLEATYSQYPGHRREYGRYRDADCRPP